MEGQASLKCPCTGLPGVEIRDGENPGCFPAWKHLRGFSRGSAVCCSAACTSEFQQAGGGRKA